MINFSSKNYTYQNTWTGFTLCHEFLDYYNFAKVMNGQAKIQVDVYNAGDYDKEVAFGMHDRNAVAEGSQFDFPFGYGEVAPTDTWYKLKAGERTTLEITDFSKIDFSAGTTLHPEFYSNWEYSKSRSFIDIKMI